MFLNLEEIIPLAHDLLELQSLRRRFLEPVLRQ